MNSDRISALEWQVAMLREALAAVEWAVEYQRPGAIDGIHDTLQHCPACSGRRDTSGHFGWCPLAAALAATRLPTTTGARQ